MVKELSTYGNIQNGKLSIVDQAKFVEQLQYFPDGEIELTVKRLFKQRTNSANRYYRGIVVPLITKAVNEEWGEQLDEEEVHELLKRQFNSRMVETKSGRQVRVAQSTTRLNTVQFAEYVDKCRDWCAEFFGFKIPDPAKISGTKSELKL